MVNATAGSSHSKASTAASEKHPTYTTMVSAALKEIGGRSGGSRTAIIKQISMNFDVGNDAKIVSTHTKKAIKKMLESGVIVHTKGEGMNTNGSFKLAPKAKSETTDGAAAKKKRTVAIKKRVVAPLSPRANGYDSDISEAAAPPPPPKKKPAAPKVQKEDKPMKVAKAAPAPKKAAPKTTAAKPAAAAKTVVSPPTKVVTPVKQPAPAKKTKAAAPAKGVSPTKKTRATKAK